jgi:predicted nucleic acid-binding protein
MNVLVDTSVWSLSLRREAKLDGPVEKELAELLREGRVQVAGAIRQELLSGLRGEVQFRKLRDRLRVFDDIEVNSVDYEDAAVCYNRCRARGIQSTAVDAFLCAIALRRQIAIFTTDNDFHHYARVLGLKIHKVRDALR